MTGIPRRKVHLGPLEQKIMDIVWESEAITVKEVHEKICCQRELAYTTVLTVMERLLKKGFVRKEKTGKSFTYYPKKSKIQTAKRSVEAFLNTMVERYGEEALLAFKDEVQKISKKDQ